MHKKYFVKHTTYCSEFGKIKEEDLAYTIGRRVLDILIIITHTFVFSNVVLYVLIPYELREQNVD